MDDPATLSGLDAAAIVLEFHRTIWRAAGNPYLAKALDGLATVLFAHTALEKMHHDASAWRLNHHRLLLEVALGLVDKPVEEAVIRHLRAHYTDPERLSSLGLKGRTELA